MPPTSNVRIHYLDAMVNMNYLWALMRSEIQSLASRVQKWPENLRFMRWGRSPKSSQPKQNYQNFTHCSQVILRFTWETHFPFVCYPGIENLRIISLLNLIVTSAQWTSQVLKWNPLFSVSWNVTSIFLSVFCRIALLLYCLLCRNTTFV